MVLIAVPKVALGLLAFVLLLSPLAVVTNKEIEAAMADEEFLRELCEATGRGVFSALWRTWNDMDDDMPLHDVVAKALREYKVGGGSARVRQAIKEHLRRR